MAWTITLDAGTISLIGSALVSAGFALWYVAKAHSHVQAIPRIDRQLQRLRSEVRRISRALFDLEHDDDAEADEPLPDEGAARKRIRTDD